MTLTANEVFRDFVTDGVPSSGAWKPLKKEIRALLAAMATGGATGLYDFIPASNTGAGTANALKADTAVALPATPNGALLAVNVYADNTASPVTVQFNGGTVYTIKTNSGNDVVPGGLKAGSVAAGYISGSTFRLLSDQASAAIQPAAEAAQAAAEAAQAAAEAAAAAVSTAPQWAFADAAAAALFKPDTDPAFISVAGAYYLKAASEPAQGGVQIGTGTWYKVAAQYPVHQYMFGAVGDGVADDTMALKKLELFARATGMQYRYLPGVHKITDTIEVHTSGDMSAATFNVDGSTLKCGVRVGTRTAGTAIERVEFHAPMLVNTAKTIGAGWDGFKDAIGIEYANLYESRLFERQIGNFGIGRHWTSYGTGCVYNTCFGMALYNNFVNEQVDTGDKTGWTNENTIVGGRYAHESSEGTAVSGCRQILMFEYDMAGDGNDYGAPNNNVWFHPSLEGDVPDKHVDIQGAYNVIAHGRWECYPPKVQFYNRVNGQTIYNEIHGGYNYTSIEYIYAGAGSSFNNGVIGPGYSSMSGSGVVLNLANQSNSGVAGRIITGYGPGINPEGKDNTSTDWSFILYPNGLDGKTTADASPRVRLDYANGRLYLGDGTAGLSAYLAGGSNVLYAGCSVRPWEDANYDLGSASLRWATIYASNGTINTSDAREKDWRGGLTDAEMGVAKRLSKLIGIYRWKDAIAKKGDGARLHAGVRAQDVQAAFEVEGLDGVEYGVLCHDTWDAEPAQYDCDGNKIRPAITAGDRYGIRYDELWAFVAAGFEARLAALEA